MPEDKSSPTPSFEISSERFLEELSKLPAQYSDKDLWLLVGSRIVSLIATGTNIQADAQQIVLLPRPLESDHQIHTGISVFLPSAHMFWECEKRMNEHGEMRLSVRFPVRKEEITYFIQ